MPSLGVGLLGLVGVSRISRSNRAGKRSRVGLVVKLVSEQRVIDPNVVFLPFHVIKVLQGYFPAVSVGTQTDYAQIRHRIAST